MLESKWLYTLRPASAADSGAIRALVRAARINPTGLDWRRFVVACTAAGEVIGCGQVKPHRDGSLELASLVVAPPWRGRGVARAILLRLLDGNPGDIHLMCRSGLGPLYARFGFRPVNRAEMPRYFQRVSRLAGLAERFLPSGERLLVMRRRGGYGKAD